MIIIILRYRKRTGNGEAYLQIEKIRFEDQLNYSVHMDDEVKHYLIPRFLIQPLVENAVKHGLKATGRMTEIKAAVKMDGQNLLITVEDNGLFFPTILPRDMEWKCVW